MSFFPTQNFIYNNTIIQITGGTASLILPNPTGTLLFGDIFSITTLTSILPTISATGSDGIQFVMIVNGSPLYYNGSAWVASNQTYAQSNPYTVVNTNAASLITSTSTLQLLLIFKGSGTTTPSISALNESIVFVPTISTPTGQCAIYVYLQDILGVDLASTVTNPQFLALNDTAFMNNGYTVARFTEVANFVTDASGTWASLNLIQTVNSGNKIRFMLTYQPNSLLNRLETIRFKSAVIPAQSSVNLTDLTAIDTGQLL